MIPRSELRTRCRDGTRRRTGAGLQDAGRRTRRFVRRDLIAVGIVPVTEQLSLRELAAVLGTKRAEMCDPVVASD